MKEGLLKPPGLGIWLVMVIGAASMARTIIGPAFDLPGALVLLTCLLVATWIVGRWLFWWVGYAAGVAAEEIAAGYRESRATGRMPVIPRDGEV